MEVLPVPLEAEFRLSQFALLAAVQVVLLGVTTRLDAPELPPLPMLADEGANWKVLPGAVSGSNTVTEYENVWGNPLISTFVSVTIDVVSAAGTGG
jgi:hypothetical protein